MITDKEGNILNSYRYDAFGNITQSQEKIHNRFKYSGEQYDSITQQYYLRARFYNPEIGRFINEDSYEGSTITPLSINLYTYTYNNPVKYRDPSGHFPSIGKIRSRLAGLIYAVDDGFFFGLAQKINGVSPKDWVGSEYEEAFFEAYNAGLITNEIYGVINIAKGSANLISGSSKFINNGGSIALENAVELSDVKSITKGAVVFYNSYTKSNKSYNRTSETKSEKCSKEDSNEETDNSGSYQTDDATPKGRVFTEHGAQHANERNFSAKNIDNIVDNCKKPKTKVDWQGRKTYEYIDNRGNKVVLNENGGIVSVHSPAKGGKYIPSPSKRK